MPKEKIAILVDGSNLYHYLRELNFRTLAEFDYRAFATFLARGRAVISATYYIGKVRSKGDEKGEELRKGQQRLLARLQEAGWQVEFGHMMEHKGVFQEKGVDVHIAVDLLKGAYENSYGTAVLVSSDTDLIPAILSVRKKGRKIEYIGFANRPSFGLMKNVTVTTLLKRNELKAFVSPKREKETQLRQKQPKRVPKLQGDVKKTPAAPTTAQQQTPTTPKRPMRRRRRRRHGSGHKITRRSES